METNPSSLGMREKYQLSHDQPRVIVVIGGAGKERARRERNETRRAWPEVARTLTVRVMSDPRSKRPRFNLRFFQNTSVKQWVSNGVISVSEEEFHVSPKEQCTHSMKLPHRIRLRVSLSHFVRMRDARRGISFEVRVTDVIYWKLQAYAGQREVNLCINVRRYENTSLLLRRRGINSDTMLYELKGYLDVLPPLLNEMIRQRIVSKFALVPKMLGPCGAGTLQPLLCRLCLNCPQLTELVLKDSVKGSDTMAFIGKTCHRLRLLDITGSRVVCSDLIRLCVRSPHRALQDFTANSTEQNVYDYDLNPLCQTLEVVSLESTRVKIKGGVFVMKAMPNLESLGNFLYTAAALKKIYGLRGKPKPCFKLKKITVPISLECGALFLSSATRLRNVEITKIRDVTDGLFEEWLRLNPLEHLESLMLRYVELTRDSVNLLLSRCPRLTRLGELGGWDIRSWECRRLKDLILRENYALHLVLYTRTSLNIGDIISDNGNSEESGMEWD
uniref:Uncharacterized protein n=1 Tax=Timema douglasi TaxID=61478 RepID=A0A7R8Z8A0_TIMDO|nr:unnamed protein product [Timema douglasi]